LARTPQRCITARFRDFSGFFLEQAMGISKATVDMEEALADVPAFDVHTHLVGGKLAARGLHDVFLYHMVVSDLYAAGCPSGARLSQYPSWATPAEARARIEEALPFVEHIRGGNIYWCLRMILNDLYDWKEPLTARNWRKLDSLIRERADDKAWQHEILDRASIKRSCTEWARREDGSDDDRLQYSLEWAMFVRCQWGEFDTALYELERCWGRQPESPAPIGGQRPKTDRAIKSLADVHAAIQHYVDVIPYGRIVTTASTFSSDIDYALVSDSEMEAAIARRGKAGPRERDIYGSYIQEAFLSALEKHGDEIVYQFALGAEPLPFETGSRVYQKTIAQLGELVGRHPKLRFQCFLASRHGNQSLCSMCRELPNLTLAGYWWHNFYPNTICQVMSERLEMLPTNKQMGFFSDAYCLEWAYGKSVLVRKMMAKVLAQKIVDGQYTKKDALEIANAVLYKAPQQILGMKPYGTGKSAKGERKRAR
jgi:glucuronate isomerase